MRIVFQFYYSEVSNNKFSLEESYPTNHPQFRNTGIWG